MDQPQHPTISTEGIAGWVLTLIASLGALVVRNRLKVKAFRDKVEAEAAPQIEKEYLEANEKITAKWETEVDKLRAQIDKVRDDSKAEMSVVRTDAMEWMRRALTAESRIPMLEAEISLLKTRVADLEKQVSEARSKAGG